MLQRQRISVIKRCQHAIGGNRVLSSSTICNDNDIITTAAAIRTLSLYSTSTLQQNYYIGHTSSLQYVISRRIHKRQYHYHKPNNIINNCNANQLRQFSSTIGYGTHHGGRGRGNDRGRHSTNNNYRIPMMKEFNTLDDAIVPYYDNLEILTPRNLSAFWSAVPRLLRYQQHQERGVKLVPQLEAIFLKTADQIHSYGPRYLVATTLGFAKIIQALQRNKRRYGSGSYEEYLHSILIGQRDAVFSFLARTAVNKLHLFKPRLLKDVAYAYALLEYVPILHDGSTLFDHIAEKSIPKLEKFNPQELANIIWSYAKAVSHPKLYEKVGDHIITRQQLNDFAPQALSNIVWAYAKAGVSYPDLFTRIGDHIVMLDQLNDFKPQELANIIWAYVKANVPHPNVFNKVADHIVLLDNLDDYNAQSLANIVWAFERANVHHHELYGRVGDHIVALDDHLNKFQPQNLSNILIAYVKAGISHPDLFNKVADHIIIRQQLNDFNSQALANTIWSYTKAEVSHPCLFNKLANHIVSFGNINDFTPQDLSTIVYAYAKAEVSHPELFDNVGDHIVTLEHMNDFSPQNLANIVYAYAKAEVPHLDLFDKVADHIVSLDNLNGYNEQEISNTVWAYHRAGVIRQDLNDKLIGVAMDRKFSTKRLETLNHWASEEYKNIEVAAQDDDNNDVDSKDGEEDAADDDADASIPEDLSLLTVVQLKDRLRDIGLRVSGRKQDLIDRLNDHFQK